MANVTLYSTGCPQCVMLKDKLIQKGIAYTEETDVNVMKNLGMTRVPMLEVDNELMDVSKALAWIKEQP